MKWKKRSVKDWKRLDMKFEYTPLSFFADIKGGKRLPKGKFLTNIINEHPYIRVQNLGNKKNLELTSEYEYVDNETQKLISKYTVATGNVLISIVGTVGLIAIVGKTLDGANLTENCAKIMNFKGLDRDFLYYYLISHEGQNAIQAATVGAVQPKLPLKNIQKLPIPRISLKKQQKIGKLLSSLDDKIELNAQINHNLEEQIRVLFEDFFINSQHCANWKQGTIADLGNVVGGSTPSKAKPEYYTSNGIAWITPKDLSGNKSKFISKGESDITPAGLRNSSAVIMPRGTVLFSSRAPIGYIAIAKNEITTNQGFKSVVPHLHIGTAFVYCFLKHNLPKIESMASGSTFKEVSGSVMKAIPAVIPAKEALMNFSTITQPLFDQQELLESENQRLTRLRDALLPKLMSGEIDVSEVEI